MVCWSAISDAGQLSQDTGGRHCEGGGGRHPIAVPIFRLAWRSRLATHDRGGKGGKALFIVLLHAREPSCGQVSARSSTGTTRKDQAMGPRAIGSMKAATQELSRLTQQNLVAAHSSYRVQTCHGSFLVAASAAAPMVAAAVPAATAPAIGCKARKNTCQCQHSSTSPAKAGDAKSLSPRNVSRDKHWRRGCKEEAP